MLVKRFSEIASKTLTHHITAPAPLVKSKQQPYLSIGENSQSLFKNLSNDQFITKMAHNTEDACKLIEVSFEYITGEC